MKKQINAHSETFIDKIFWFLIVAVIFTCCIATLSSCHTRKVLAEKSKSEVSIDSSFKKSEVKEIEQKTDLNQLIKEHNWQLQVQEVWEFGPDSNSNNHKENKIPSTPKNKPTGATKYTKTTTLSDQKKETNTELKNELKSKDVKKDEGKVKIDSSKVEKTKDVETSGQTFGTTILIGLAFIVIGGFFVLRNKI